MSIRAAMLFLSAFLSLAVSAQSSAAPEAEERTLPAYVRFVDDISPEIFDMSDSLFYRISGSTIFKVNKYNLNYNDQLIKDLGDWILPEVQRKDWKLVGISLRGAASPEGPYDNNVMLSKRRAKALTDFLIDKMGQSYQDLLTTNTTAEDYLFLVKRMEEMGDKDTQKVKDLLEPCHGDPKLSKKALMAADGGRLWKRILHEHFPVLRAARVVLFFQPKMYIDKSFQPPSILDVAVNTSKEFKTKVIEPFYIEIEEPEPIVRDHVLSVSTNLLYDAFYMPNFGMAPMWNVELEYYPKRGHWTYLAAFTSPYYHRWSKNKFFQIRDYRVEVRRYMNPGDCHTGLFVGGYVNNNKYGIGLSKTKGWQGEGLGAAAKAGYVWKLCRTGRWRLEVCAAIGGYVTRYDPYVYGNPVTGNEDGDYYYDYTGSATSFKKRNYQRMWFGPTEFGIKVRYDLLYRRHQKRGVSFNRKEELYYGY